MQWQTSKRKLQIDRPLVMGILNVTPDSFSDGGKFSSVDDAVRRAEQMIADGVDIIDIGGESTRPGSARIEIDEEIRRVVPVIEAIAAKYDTPISIDTSRSEVAKRAMAAGAEIINDISGLRFDASLADVAVQSGAGIVLMHSRGEFIEMHSQPPVDDIVAEVISGLSISIDIAVSHGVSRDRIAVDVGIGFGKTPEQNLELIAKLDKIVAIFENYPMLVGASRKSFLTRLFGNVPPTERLGGSLAAAMAAVNNGAAMIRVHDVHETVQAIRTMTAIKGAV